MKKCILLCRVSTEKQSLDSQEQELFKMATKDGYEESNIILISEKESGIKLDEDERKGLNRMKESIEEDSSIDCVYSWEISRISRRKKILFSILEYLTNRHIQLKIKEPSIVLLNEDGTINEAGETVFTLFAQLAESEMRNKKVRFKRGKEACYKMKRYIGGKITYGYVVNSDTKLFEIDEEKKKNVIDIFHKYNSRNYSIKSLARYCQNMGYFENKKYISIITQLKCILKNMDYTGVNRYPKILDKSYIDEAAIILNENITSGKYTTKHVYYGKSIIFCPVCGEKICGRSAVNSYKCEKCGQYISLNIVDNLLWYVAKTLYVGYLAHNSNESEIEYKTKLAENNRMIDNLKNDNKNLAEKYDKIDERIDLDEHYNISKAKERQKDILIKIKENKSEIDKLNKSNYDLIKLLKANTTSIINYDNINDIQNDKQRQSIIKQMIEHVTFERLSKLDKKIIIRPRNWNKDLIYYAQATSNKFWDENKNDINVEIVKKTVRQKYYK